MPSSVQVISRSATPARVGWSSRVWARASGIRCHIRAISRILEHSTAYRTEFFRSLLEVRLLDFAFGAATRSTRAPRSLVLLHALESLFKLRDQRSFAGLETVASHDAPKITATRPRVRIVHGHQIFGRPACHEDDNVGFGGPVHNHQFVPLFNGVLHRGDRVP